VTNTGRLARARPLFERAGFEVRPAPQELILRAVRRFGRAPSRLGLAVESRALDRSRHVARDDHREREVDPAVAAGRFGDRQGHRAEDTRVRDERCDDPRLRTQLPEDVELLGILRGRAEIGLGDPRDENRPACANDGRDPVGGRGIEPVSGTDLVDERLLGAVDMRAGDAVERVRPLI